MNKLSAVGLALTALLLGLTACGGGGTESLPSSRPEMSADRTSSSPRTNGTRERATEGPTLAEATPARTTEPMRTTEPAPAVEPTRAAAPAVEPTRAAAPAATTFPPATPTEEAAGGASSPAAAGSSTDDGGGWGLLGWIFIFAQFAVLIAIVLVGRSRQVARWRAELSDMAAETRTVIDVRLTPVLAQRTAAERRLSWPPVRDGLAGLQTRWAGLSTRAPETAGQASAAQIAGLLRHLIAVVDAESDALAAGSDWRPLRAEVDADLDALTVALGPQQPPGEPGPAAYAG